jgi:hypothetical protein
MRWGKGKIVSYITTGLILLCIVVLDFLLFWPVDVLQDWHIHVEPKTYRRGETLAITSTFTKVREAKAEASRYLKCSGTKYPVSESQGGRKPGTATRELAAIVPDTVPVPSTCSFGIEATYRIYGIRRHTETQNSNMFEVN